MPYVVTKPIPAEPVEDLGGGNTRDANGVERYRGYNISEATIEAVAVGTEEAWWWLQAWCNAELEEDDKGPGCEEE